LSYFRRKNEDERAFHTCNLRKSYGFHLVAQGADPIPDADECSAPYHISLEYRPENLHFYINDLPILDFKDDGRSYGPLLAGGRIGFRQMAPLKAAYSHLAVYQLV
jgi:hypothetical protein